jgi:hypothetical protein
VANKGLSGKRVEKREPEGQEEIIGKLDPAHFVDILVKRLAALA